MFGRFSDADQRGVSRAWDPGVATDETRPLIYCPECAEREFADERV
jgi:hypothetical protein